MKMVKIQPPIVHADYDDYDEEQLDEMINLMIQKTQSLYTCTVLKFIPILILNIFVHHVLTLALHHTFINNLPTMTGMWQVHMWKEFGQTAKPERPH